MAVNRKGKEVVDAKAAATSYRAAAASGGGKKRPLSAASTSAYSSSRAGSCSGTKKRGRASSASRFIDDAAVDADESDDFDEDDDEDGDAGEESPAFMNDIQAGFKDAKGAGKSNIPFFLKEEELSGDELEEFVKERYGHGSDHVMCEEDDNEHDDRKSLLHSMDDPIIWRVRCMVGYERHIAFCLIQKYVSLLIRGSNLPIISVFSLEHIKGYVYIEADKQRDVAEACKGFCTLYTSKIGLVPANEVPRLLSIQNKSNQIAEGMWVRMKSGKYKGDLAQVVAVDDVRKRATVKLVPRIDLQALAKKFGGGISLKQAAIPDARLISSHELEDFRPHIEIRRDRETGELFEILDGLMLKDGYLYKKVSILSLNCFGAQPSSVELMKFEPAKRDEPQVSEFISDLYGERKRNGLDPSLEDKGKSFKLHDLVVFGRKDCGVIIGMKCDSFQILKGGVEEQVVVTVPQKAIKNSCIDKMFTASDSHMKTIYINNTVKVLEGPQKGREGIVKHMYKGYLFVDDEENTENTGFFCVKSGVCEVMKENCHGNKGEKSYHVGSKAHVESSSMPQSPMKCSQERDYDGGFKRYRQDDRDQTFTVGQTLRIRVGPLKGYLCRVVRIYRSDVTVKLDSLVKLITVNSNHLSDANIRSFGNTRDDTMSKPDQFGSEERLSKGELANEDMGEPPSKSSWDFEPTSSARVGLSTWGSSSANCDDNKACNDQVDDPWGSKITSGHGSQAGHSDNVAEQMSHPATVDGWNNWAKAEKSAEREHDSWKGTSTNEGEETVWNKALSSDPGQPGHFEMQQGSGNNWAKATTDGWNNKEKAEKSTECEHEDWKVNSIDEGETGGWKKATSSNHGQDDGWSKRAGDLGESDGKRSWGSNSDRPVHFEVGQGSGSSSWDKATADGWSNKSGAERSTDGVHENWQGNSMNKGETGAWVKPTSSNYGQEDSWIKRAGDNGESDGKRSWGGNTEGPEHCEVGQGSGSSWAKATTDGWSKGNKAEKSSEVVNESWKGNNTNDCETSGWSKAGSSNQDQTDTWNKATGVNSESGGKMDWESHPDKSGQGFGYGRGGGDNTWDSGDRNQSRGWSRRSDYGGDHGSNRGGRSRNSEGGSGDRQDSWNRSRDSDGGRGRGRGRGFFGGSGRGGNQEDNWKETSYSDVGWSSGRGRGRGRRGRGVGDTGGSRDDYNDSSHFGRGGKDHSSGWKNGQGISGHGGFSADALSSWKSDQTSSWGTFTASGKNEAFDDVRGKNHSCGEKEPFLGGSSGWNSVGGDHSATRNGGVSWERSEKSNMNQGCSSNSGWDNDKLGVGDKHIDGKQSATWEKAAADKCSAPEACKNKQFNWSHADAEENARDEDWSVKSNSSRADQSGVDISASSGHQSSAWVTKSAVIEKVGEDGGSGGSWDRIKQSSKNEESVWGTEKREDRDPPKNMGNQHSGWDCSAEHGAKSSTNAGDNWETGNKSSDRKNSESGNWYRGKAVSGSRSSDWGQRPSGDEIEKDTGSGRWDSSKPRDHGTNWDSQEVGGGNWSSPKPISGGKQASDWNNDGSNWNKPRQFGGRHSSGWNNQASGDGARRNDDRSGDWSGGKSYGGDQSSGWKGNMSYGRGNGRGRGRGRGREPSCGWGGTHRNQEAGGAGFSEFSGRQESYGRGKPTSWTHERFADKGSGSGDGQSGWSRGKDVTEEQSCDVKKGTSGEDGWRQEKGAWKSWDSGAGDQAGGSGWKNSSAVASGWSSCRTVDSNQSNNRASAWTEGTTTPHDARCEQKMCPDGAQGSDVRKSDVIPSKTASGEASRGSESWNEPKGSDSNVATGWNSMAMSVKQSTASEDPWNQKKDSFGADGPGGWGNNNVSSEEPHQNVTRGDPWG